VVVMGRVAGAYGVRGFVRIDPLSEDPLALLGHGQWQLRRGEHAQWQSHAVCEARPHGGSLVALLDGVSDREAATRWRGALVGVLRSALPPLDVGELYWADLEGLAVVNRDGVALGNVGGLVDTGAHPVLRVQCPGRHERLIPWVPAYIDDVDLAARRIAVDWPADD
jgi:16S rRNA processing protein RimM